MDLPTYVRTCTVPRSSVESQSTYWSDGIIVVVFYFVQKLIWLQLLIEEKILKK